jgi:hypothetical protein
MALREGLTRFGGLVEVEDASQRPQVRQGGPKPLDERSPRSDKLLGDQQLH